MPIKRLAKKWAARWGGADGPVGSTVGGSAFEPGKGLGVALIVLSILDRMESISHPTGTIELAWLAFYQQSGGSRLTHNMASAPSFIGYIKLLIVTLVTFRP